MIIVPIPPRSKMVQEAQRSGAHNARCNCGWLKCFWAASAQRALLCSIQMAAAVEMCLYASTANQLCTCLHTDASVHVLYINLLPRAPRRKRRWSLPAPRAALDMGSNACTPTSYSLLSKGQPRQQLSHDAKTAYCKQMHDMC